jgi:DNA-binding transcriptional regulator YdaS (Cro superfamily)
MKLENLTIINNAIDRAGITQKYLSQIAGIQHTQVNEMLSGRRTIKNANFAMAIEALTNGSVKAKWILETAVTDSIDEEIESARVFIREKLEREQELINKRLSSI